jgi:ankyrin repeat protein
LLAACGADDKARQALLRVETKNKFTPLHWACQEGHVKVAEALLAACGADDKARQALLRAENKDKFTPLHYACLEGHVEVAEALLGHADSDHERMRMLTAKTVTGDSPAAVARAEGHSALAEKLEAMCPVER